ncbi:MAG TPA: hypothetical protein ENK25_10490 [Bacteroidetes bacterium]|nr:hypothetical protein [Bacteroidota bacterium]
MMRRVMKRIFRVFLIIGGMVLAGLIIVSILLHAYSSDIQKVIIGKLNEQLNTKAAVGEIRYSLIKHFPYLSATFQSVTISGSLPLQEHGNKPFLKAGEVILDMNIVDALLFRKLSIKRIVVTEGDIHLIKNRKGQKNWDIFKDKGPKKTGKKSNPLKIHLFRIVNTKYSYAEEGSGFRITGKIRKAQWDGGWWPGTAGYVQIKHAGLVVKNEKQVTYNFPDGFVFNAHVQTGKNTMHLSKGRVVMGGFPIDFTGDIGNNLKSKGISIHLHAKKIKADEVVQYLKKRKIIHSETGWIRGNISVDGELSGKGSGPFHLNTMIQVTGDHFVFVPAIKNQELKADKWKAEITLHLGKSSLVSVHILPSVVRFNHAGITTEMFWEIRNKKILPMNIYLNGEMKIKDLYGWTGENFSKIVKSGNIIGKVKVGIPSVMFKSGTNKKLSELRVNGQISFRDLVIFDDSMLYVTNLDTKLIPGQDIALWGNNVIWTGNSWQIRGRVRNMMKYLEGSGPAVFYTDLRGTKLDIGEMLSFFRLIGDVSDKPRKAERKTLIPLIRSNIFVDTLRYNGFKAGDVKGFLNYDDPVILLKQVTFTAMEGSCSGQMELTLKEKGTDQIKTYLEPEHINVKKLFYSFRNFNQEFIRAENLKGYVSGSIAFQARFDSNGKVFKPSILSDSYLEISRGELIGFEPLYKLSKYIRLSELKNIRFSTLKNEIFIHDQQVVIPDMQVKSSALNITVSGVHHFEGDFDYRIGILLSDYLARKARKGNQNNPEFGNVIEDPDEGKTTLFLRYTGNGKESGVYYDKKKVKEKISKELREEKSRLKMILREETGLFQKDTSNYLPESDGMYGKKKFRIEWPEEEQKKTPLKVRDTIIPKKKFKVIWEEEPDTTQKK